MFLLYFYVKNNSYFIFILLIILFISCRHTTDPIKIEEPIETDFSNFYFEFVTADSFHIISNDDFYLNTMSVRDITVYGNNELAAKVKPTYVNLDSMFAMQFNIPIKSAAPSVDYNIYFSKYDNTYVQIDTTITFFPALANGGARIEFMLADINWESSDVPDSYSYFGNPDLFYEDLRYWGPDAFDIDTQGNIWVFRIRDWFLKWNTNNNTVEYLDVYQGFPTEKQSSTLSPQSPWGQDVVYQNNVLYFDYLGYIRKYDFNDDSYTYFFTYEKYYNNYPFPLIHIYPSVEWLANDDENIYFLEHCYILTIQKDGAFVNYFEVDSCGTYAYRNMEVYDNILYIVYDYNNYSSTIDKMEIRRYDLIENVILSPIKLPNNYQYSGFRIMYDRVYYIDWTERGNEKMVSIPLKEFLGE